MITYSEWEHPHRLGGTHWRVEWWSGERRMFPVATAYVVVIPGAAQVNFVFVVDEYRGQGIACKLLEACRSRWPGIGFTVGVNAAGDALVRKVMGGDAEQ